MSRLSLRAALAFLFVLPLLGLAQNNWLVFSSTEPATVTVCAGTPSTFSLTVSNAHTAAVNNIVLQLNFPPGMTYVPGSVSNPAVLEIPTLAPNRQDFFIASLAASGGSESFSFDLNAGCDLIPYVNAGNSIVHVDTANYTGGFDLYTSGTWNVLFPSLSFNSIGNQSYSGAVGDIFTRTFTLINGGNGALSEPLTFSDQFGTGLALLGSSLPGTLTGNNYGITVTDYTPYGDGDALLETGETVSFTVDYQITDCSLPLNSLFSARWGCNSQDCQVTTSTGNAVIPPSPPNLVFEDDDSFSSCLDGSIANAQQLRVINNGTGTASNVVVQLNWENWNAAFTTTDTANITLRVGSASAAVNIVPDSFETKISTAVTACAEALPFGAFRNLYYTLPDLAPGDTAYIDFNNYNCCPVGVCNQRIDGGGWRFGAQWTDQCETTTYTRTLGNGANGIRVGIGDDNSTIGPTDLTSSGAGCFRVEINRDDWGIGAPEPDPLAAGGYLEWRVNLPPDVAYVPGSAQWVDFDGDVWPIAPGFPTLVGNLLTVRYLIPNANGAQPAGFDFVGSYLEYCLTTSCGTGGNQTISNNLVLQLNPGCGACELDVLCNTRNVNVVCPQPCPDGGIVFENYRMARTNFGLADDAPLDGQPDAVNSLDVGLVRQDRVFFGDTLRTSFVGTVATSGLNPTWARGFAATQFDQGSRLTHLGTTLRIFDASSGSSFTCTNVPVSLTNLGGQSRQWEFAFGPGVIGPGCPAMPGGYVFDAGDSVFLDVDYRVTDNVAGASPVDLTANNAFYLSNAGVATSTTAPAPVDQFSCGNFSGNAAIYGFGFNLGQSGNNSFDGCEIRTLSMNAGFVVNPDIWGDYFPYEYRLFNYPDSFTVNFAPGWTYVGNPEYLYRRLESPGDFAEVPWTALPPAMVTDLGTGVVFSVADLFDFNGGPLVPGETYVLQIRYDIQPTCQAAATTTTPDNFQILRNFNWVGDLGTLPDAQTDFTNNNAHSLFHNKPTLELSSPLPIVDGDENLVEWTLNLENNSGIAGAENTWFALQSGAQFNILAVEDLATSTIIAPTAGGIYEVGNLGTGATNSYRITATFNNCTLDSFLVVAGWDCPGYPANVASYPCEMDSFYLGVLPRNAEVQVTLLSQPSGTVDLCGDAVYEVQVANVQPGTGYSNRFILINPPGGGLSSVGTAEIEYPIGSGFAPFTVPPTTFGNLTLWDIDANLPTVGLNGLEGITGAPDNAYRLRFTLEPGCSFISGGTPRFYAQAQSPCGSFTFNYISADPLNLTGATTNYNTAIAEIQIDTLRPCSAGGPQDVRVRIVNLGPAATGVDDHFIFALDPSANYAAGSFVGISNPPAPNPASSVVAGRRELDWTLPSGVPAGDTIEFTFQLDAVGMACGAQEFEAITTVSAALTCVDDGTLCQVNVSTGSQLDTFALLKPDLLFNSGSGVYDVNTGTMQTTFDYDNIGDTAVTGTPYVFDIYLDVDQNGLFNAPPDDFIGNSLYAAGYVPGGNYVANETTPYTMTPTPVATTDVDLVVVLDNATNPCLCETEVFSIPPVTILPVQFLNFTAELQADGRVALAWTAIPDAAATHFELQRAAAGEAFAPLAQQPITGTPGTAQTYTDVDPQALAGVSFYRVVGVDSDGRRSYSNAVEIRNTGPGSVGLFPNPARQTATLTLSGSLTAENVQVFDPRGARVAVPVIPAATTAPAVTALLLDLAALPAGAYNVVVQTPNGPVAKLLVRER